MVENIRRFIVSTQFPENSTIAGNVGEPLGGAGILYTVVLYWKNPVTQFSEFKTC